MSDITPLSTKEARLARSHWLIQGNKQKVSRTDGSIYRGYFKISVAAGGIDNAIALVRKRFSDCEITSVQNQGSIEIWED